MTNKEHWEKVYQAKASDTVSWYQPHLSVSLGLIERAVPERAAAIIDIGAGESTLVDDLLDKGYRDLHVLDLSDSALAVTRQRLGAAAATVTWMAADILQVQLPAHAFDLWHDRALFHFLTDPPQRATYVAQLSRALRPGAHVILATFGLQGPEQCSKLDTVRYDPASLMAELGARFTLIESVTENHQTPAGAMQQFLYCHCRFE